MNPKEVVPESANEAESPDSTGESGGLNSQSDGLPSHEQMEKMIQREERIKNTSEYKRAKNEKPSAAYKSQQRTMEAMGDFYGEVAVRNKRAGYKERIFSDDKALELAADSSDYMIFCMKHSIIPTWNLYAVWLDVDMSTLYAEENLSSKCSRILKNVRNRIFTILEQSTLQREGNPAAGIFFLKALWGLSDQQPLDVNIHTDAPKQLSSEEVQNIIDITPDEIHE